jgi:O-antigen ligase
MEVTPIGWILLFVGLLLAIFRPRWLYIVTIFSLPFTATDIINVGSGLNASGVQAPMYLGSLLLIKHGLLALRGMSFPFPQKNRACLIWLGTFVAVIALSLVMPIWLDGHVQVPASILGDLSTETLHLRSSNVTGVLYVVFGYAFAYLTVTLNQTAAAFRLTLKAFMAGLSFSALWGIFELACKATTIGYPSMIFNTGTSLATMGYLENEAGFPRLSSVAVEPSIFAQSLLIAVSLCLPFVFGSLSLFGKTRDRCMFFLLVLVLCLTTSSTAYTGLFILALTVILLSMVRGMLKLSHFAIPLIGIGLGTVIYRTVPAVEQILDSALFTKSTGYSAIERLMTVNNALDMFREHPVLGIGWASVVSHDLFAQLLGNSGILGLLSFIIAMYSIFRALYRSIRSRDKSLRGTGLLRMDFALYVALAVTLATCAISGFIYMFAFFWFICGFAIAASGEMNLQRSVTHAHPPVSLSPIDAYQVSADFHG